MSLKKITLAGAAVALAAAPAVAQVAPLQGGESGPKNGAAVIVGVLAGAAIIAGIIVAASENKNDIPISG